MNKIRVIVAKEFDYLVAEDDHIEAANCVALPKSTFDYLSSRLEPGTSDTSEESFFRLCSFKKRIALQITNHAGVIQSPDGIQLEILPKIYDAEMGLKSLQATRFLLLKMLRALRGGNFKSAGIASVQDARMPLLEIFITQFLESVNYVVKGGVRSDYIRVHESKKFLKGRLLISQQLRRNSSRPEQFFVDHESYQVDRPANRLIKTALLLVQRHTKSSKNQRFSRELLFAFDDVPASVDLAADFRFVRKDRSMAHYAMALSWCKLLLSRRGITSSSGDFTALTLMFPMEQIFEDYVAQCLRRDLHHYFPNADRIKTQARKHSLVESHAGSKIFSLMPDICIEENRHEVCVMDTKWKLLDSGDRRNKYGISQADMYQLYAYGHKYLAQQDNKTLVLIYPMTDTFKEPLPLFEYEQGHTLEVVPFDIAKGRMLTASQSIAA